MKEIFYLIKEMEKCLREYNYNSLVLNTDEDEALEKAAIVSAISKNVDGIILCPVQKTRNNLDFLKNVGIPYLLIGRYFQGDDSGYVVCDDFNSGYVAAKHLLDLNHKKLLFINAPLYISGAYLRLEALLKMGKKELVLSDIRSFFGHMSQHTGTLWEYRQEKGSKDHGFASYALVAIMKALEN